MKIMKKNKLVTALLAVVLMTSMAGAGTISASAERTAPAQEISISAAANTKPAEASDASPETGAKASLTSIAAILLGVAYIINKKNK